MPDLTKTLTQRFQRAIVAAFGDEHSDIDPIIRASAQAKFGDYQANVAMSLAKQVGGENPRDIAQKIIDNIQVDDICTKLEIAGPGFINLYLSTAFLNDRVNRMARDERLDVPTIDPPQKVVVDYSSPNVAKEMHVGHLRSTIIGDCIARVLEFQGDEVIRQNHLGDWGTQFGMLIEYLVEQGWQADGDHSISDLNVLYKQSKGRFDEDADFADRARKRVVDLQSGEATAKALWQALIEESKRHFNQVYKRLGVQLTDDDVCGESFYNDRLADVVADLDNAGLLKESQGAAVVFPEGFKDRDDNPLGMIVRKSDGGYLYATTDLAAARYRANDLEADRIVYVTDARQANHFAMLFSVLAKTGWVPSKVRLDHVMFGMVLGPDKKPYKSRDGNTVSLADVINEGVERAAAVITEKNPDLPADEQSTVSEAVGIGAIKYVDLSNDRIKDYIFDWDRMLSFDGNTAPYIQNAYVRVHGIFRKGEVARSSLKDKTIMIAEPAERLLAIKLLQLPSVIESVSQSLEPHRLCTYLYELASAFHKFFESCPVLSAKDEATKQSRLKLCDVVAETFKCGLGLLGIDVIERM